MAGRGRASNGRKPSSARTAAPPRAARRSRSATADVDDKIIDTALALAARDGWRATTLAAIAVEAGVGAAALYDRFPDKTAIVAGVMRRIDRTMLASGDGEAADGSPRDRLFDVIMRRFEALQAERAGIAALASAGIDPVGAPTLLGAWSRSLAWMLEAAGVDASGLAGRLRIAGLAVVYARTFRVWVADDSADLGKTMAALDRLLAQAERWAQALPGVRRA